MGLEHSVWNLDDGRGKPGRFLPVKGKYLAIAEIHARLNNDANDAGKGCCQAPRCKCGAMKFVSSKHSFWFGHGKAINYFSLAAGDRNFRADHIAERLPGGSFGHGTEFRSAFGHGFFREDCLIGAGHAGIKVNLAEPRLDIGFDHYLGRSHRLGRRKGLPRIWAEMITAQHETAGIEARFSRETLDEGAKCSRRHARIAAVLINLVTGSFDENPVLSSGMGAENGAQRIGMRRAP